MPASISHRPRDLSVHKQQAQRDHTRQAAEHNAAARKSAERSQPRDEFEKSAAPRRRSTDGDGFETSPQPKAPPVARPDGQGPANTPVKGVEGGRRRTDAPASQNPGDDALGSLSKKYESGNRGPGTVSNGKGDAGGVSYGTYQMTSKARNGKSGTASEFVDSLKKTNPAYHQALAGKTPGSPEFTKAWKDLAAKDPKGFAAAQHEFIKQSHYEPSKTATEKATGIDFDNRSKTLRDVLWSTADQHRGGTANIFKRAMHGRDPSKMTDQEIIKAVYAERGRTKANGQLAYFGRNSQKIQNGVANRFRSEERDAQAALQRERQQQQQQKAA